MLQDLARGGRTEIDFMNGHIARLGREKGIPCPVNEMLTLLVKAVEGTEWRPPEARVLD
jgi:2-dehydropantoate 2-reductase